MRLDTTDSVTLTWLAATPVASAMPLAMAVFTLGLATKAAGSATLIVMEPEMIVAPAGTGVVPAVVVVGRAVGVTPGGGGGTTT